MLDLKKIVPQKNLNEDDLKILRTWAEFSEDRKNARSLMYEFEMEDESGNVHHLFKCVKLVRVVRLPKAAKQSDRVMQTHSRLLQAVWQQDIKLVTVIANILKPVPFGLMYLYGIQAIATTEEEAKNIANRDYISLIHLLQGSYRVLEFQELTYQELEWLREKMFSMKHMTVVRGIPKAKGGDGKKQGAEIAYGVDTSMDEEDTTEEFIAGMSGREYVVQVLSTPVKAEHLERWLAQTAQEMTAFNSQLQGTSNIGFNLSVPMMFMANVGASQGWSHSYTESNIEGITLSESLQSSFATSIGENVSQSFGESVGHSYGQSYTESVGENYSTGFGTSDGTSWGRGIGFSQGISQNFSENTSLGNTYSESVNSSTSHTDSTSSSMSEGTSANTTISQGTSHGTGDTVTNTNVIGRTSSKNETLGWGESTTISEGRTDEYTRTDIHTTKETLTYTEKYKEEHKTTYTTEDSLSLSDNESGEISHGRKLSTTHTETYSTSETWFFRTTTTSTTTSDTDVVEDYTNRFGWNRGDSFGYTNTRTTEFTRTIEKTRTVSYERTWTDEYKRTVSIEQSHSDTFGTNGSISQGSSIGTMYGDSTARGMVTNITDTMSQSVGTSQNISQGYGSSDAYTQGVGENWGQSVNKGQGASVGQTQSGSTSSNVGGSSGVSRNESWGLSRSRSYGQNSSESYTQSATSSTGRNYSESNSMSHGQSWGQSTAINKGQVLGTNGGTTNGTSSSMGFGPSVGFGISYQWIDQEVKNLLTLLEFQNTRLMKALSGGTGAFFTDVYIATPDRKAQEAAAILAKGAWMDDSALVCPLQVLNLKDEEQKHLLYHFSAFSADNAKINDTHQMQSYKYSTVLLPIEYTAYTHLPRISDGGVYADVGDVPKFAVPSMKKGDIYMGKILSGERWTAGDKYESIFEYRLDESELMHGIFTGESRSGKTVAATRFVVELTKLRRKKTGKRLRIVALDPKQDWRILAKFVEPERFHFYSLGNPEFRPINLNICKVPYNVNPQVWVDGIIDIFCRSYGLLERGKAILGETFYSLYEDAGVFEDSPNWRDFVPERSSKITMSRVYERMMKIKIALDDELVSSRGRMGTEAMDCYMCLLDRLQVFGRKFSIESRLFARQDGIAVDELIGKDDIIVLESYGLETTFKNFMFGCITSGFFKYAQGHEGGFLAPDQYETVLIIEEANEVLTGSDTAGAGGGMPSLAGQSEFERILDQAAGLGLFIIAITQKIADMPSSCVANAGLLFAGKISRVDDVSLVIRKIARDERYDDRDILKWFPRSPIGWFVCRSSRNYDFKDTEPILVHIDPLGVDPPNNAELEGILVQKEAMQLLNT